MRVLIDTSIIIDFLRQKEKSKTVLFHLSKYELFASILTHAESYAGKSIWEKENAKEMLEKVFSNIKIISLDENLSKKAGEISARYNIEIVDAIIATTAILSKMNLATLNIKDFAKIKNLRLMGLAVV